MHALLEPSLLGACDCMLEVMAPPVSAPSFSSPLANYSFSTLSSNVGVPPSLVLGPTLLSLCTLSIRISSLPVVPNATTCLSSQGSPRNHVSPLSSKSVSQMLQTQHGHNSALNLPSVICTSSETPPRQEMAWPPAHLPSPWQLPSLTCYLWSLSMLSSQLLQHAPLGAPPVISRPSLCKSLWWPKASIVTLELSVLLVLPFHWWLPP